MKRLWLGFIILLVGCSSGRNGTTVCEVKEDYGDYNYTSTIEYSGKSDKLMNETITYTHQFEDQERYDEYVAEVKDAMETYTVCPPAEVDTADGSEYCSPYRSYEYTLDEKNKVIKIIMSTNIQDIFDDQKQAEEFADTTALDLEYYSYLESVKMLKDDGYICNKK